MIKGIKYALFLCIGIGLAYYASKDADFDTIWNAATHLNWGWAFLSMLASYVAMMFRGWRWRILIEPLGYTTRASSPVHAVAFGYLMNDLVPRSGEVARCAVLNKSEQIPMDKLVGTVILERLVDSVNLLMVIALVSWLQADALVALWDKITAAKAAAPGQTQEKSYLIYYILFFGALAAAVGWWTLKKLQHIAFFGKIYQFALGVFDGLKSILALKQKGWFTLHTIGIWVCWLLMAYFMMKALADTNYMNMADALFFLVAGSFGMVVPTQGGLGAYHLTSKWGFEALGYAGTLGLTFAWISWVGKTIVEIIVGVIGFIILDQRAKKKILAATA